MISKLEVENFQSIRDCQVLDLTVPGNAPKETDRLAETWSGSKARAPKVVAIFGANGSGKSNVLRALSFLIWFAGHSFSLEPKQRIPFEPFNDTNSLSAPTRLKLWTAGPENPSNKDISEVPQCQYSYELIISNGDRRAVLNERIYYWPSETGRPTKLIERYKDGSVRAAKSFGLAKDRKVLEKILRPNASVISTLAQLNHPFAINVMTAALQVRSNIFIERTEPSDEFVLRNYVDRPDLVEQFNKEISRIDVGVRALDVQRTAEGPSVTFIHEGLTIPMPFVLESHGTRQFIKHFPSLFDVLDNGGIAIIDELDAAIHPMIMPEILRWFHDPKRNPFNAQLWMSCNSASLLEELSKDEVVLCEKDWQGRTEIYSLNDLKAVRRDDNYYRKYLGGAFGAVPRVG